MNMASSSMEIIKDATEFIKGNNAANQQQLWFLPLENCVKPYQTNMMFVYSNYNSDNNFMPINALQASLVKLIDNLPIIGGEIAEEDELGNASVKLTNKGIMWTNAKINCKLQDIIQSKSNRYNNNNRFNSVMDYANINALSLQVSVNYGLNSAMLSIQVTRFECNSIIMGISGQHLIFDSDTMGQFIKYWAMINNNLSLDNININWNNRSFIMNVPEEYKNNSLINRPVNCVFNKNIDNKNNENNNNTNNDTSPITYQVIHFSGSELSNMKKEASKQINDYNTPFISTYDALLAHLIQILYNAEHSNNTNNNKNLRISELFNARKLFNFNEKNNFFGMFAFWLHTSINVSNINNLSYLACLIHNIHNTKSKQDLINYNRYLLSVSNKLKYDENLIDHNIGGADFHSTNWSKFGFYRNSNFGYGECDYYGPTQMFIPKVLMFLDSSINDGYDVVFGTNGNIWDKIRSSLHQYAV